MNAIAKRETLEAGPGAVSAVQRRALAEAREAGFASVDAWLDHLRGQRDIAERKLGKAIDTAAGLAVAARMADPPPAEALAQGEPVIVPAAYDPGERGRREPGRTLRNMAAAGVVKFANHYPDEVSVGMVKAGVRYAELKDSFAGGQGRAATMRFDDAPRSGAASEEAAAHRAMRAHDLYLAAREVLLPEEVAVLEAVQCAWPPKSLSAAGRDVFGARSRQAEKTYGMAKMAMVSALWRLSVLFGYETGPFAGRGCGWGFEVRKAGR